MNKSIKIIIGAVVVAAGVMAFFQSQQAAKWRREVQSLQLQQTLRAEQIAELQRERDAARQSAGIQEEQVRTNRIMSELLRLRGEVGVLKNENQRLRNQAGTQILAEATDLMVTRPAYGVSYDSKSWTISGSDYRSLSWNLLSDSGRRATSITLRNYPEAMDAAAYKKQVTDQQLYRGEPAEFVSERSQKIGGQKWAVLEFRSLSSRTPRNEVHYFLPTQDGYVTAYVNVAEANRADQTPKIDAFLNQIRVSKPLYELGCSN